MINIHEAITAYNYFCALSISLLGGNVNSWTERSRINVNEYEAECVRLEAKCKEDFGAPYNIPVRIEDSENPKYYIHVYVDKEHKFSGKPHTVVPEIVKFREKIEGIAPVIAVTIPEDLINLDFDVDSFEDTGYMYYQIHSFYSLLFTYIITHSSPYYGMQLADILSCLYLSRLTMFDIDKWTEYRIKCAKYNVSKPDLAFLIDHEPEERKKAKLEFRLKCDIEEYKFFAETVKDMREKYTFNTNPQVWHGDDFIKDCAKYLDYCKYRERYRDYSIRESIGPDPIPV
jgi:hypothetical protein